MNLHRRLMLRLTWFLEDIADRVFGVDKASEFYPSKHFESPLVARREGSTRVSEEVTFTKEDLEPEE